MAVYERSFRLASLLLFKLSSVFTSDEPEAVSSRGCDDKNDVVLVETSCDVTGSAVVDWVVVTVVFIGQCLRHFDFLLITLCKEFLKTKRIRFMETVVKHVNFISALLMYGKLTTARKFKRI